MAHVAQYKKNTVNDLVRLFKSYPIIGCLDMENIPAPQLQQMRAQLRKQVVMTMTKRRLIKIAVDRCKDVKGLEKIKDYLLGMPALLFTKEDPFKLNKTLQKSKSIAPAKAGQTAPKDIVINAGPTPFSPGPVIGELSKLGLKTGVEGNKIVIKENKVIVRKGETIKPDIASVLLRLDIKPMEVGLNLLAVLENGEIIPKEILTVSEEDYLINLQKAHIWAFNLSIEAGIITKDNIEFLLGKAFNQAKTIAFEGNIISDVVVKDMLSRAEKQALNIKEEGNIETEEKKEKVIEKQEEKEVKSEKKEEGFSKDVDANVMSMIRKTKDFMKGKITADDILKEGK